MANPAQMTSEGLIKCGNCNQINPVAPSIFRIGFVWPDFCFTPKPSGPRTKRVAVGMPVAQHPPHRSVREGVQIRHKNIMVRFCFGSPQLLNPVAGFHGRLPLINYSLISSLPSPTSAGGRPLLFGWFIGTTPESDSSAACMSGVRPMAFPDRPELSSGATEVSRFSCIRFLSVRGVYDYAGPGGDSRYRHHRYGLPRL